MRAGGAFTSEESLSAPGGARADEVRSIAFEASDGIALKGQLYTPAVCQRVEVLIILCCVGSDQLRYESLARHMARLGWHVVTFDYRGVGASRTSRAARAAVSMTAWGERDFDSVIRWVKTELAPQRLVALGHSIGGQLLPFAQSAHHLDAAVCVCAQRGNHRFWNGPKRALIWFLWWVFVPLCARLLGRLPLHGGRERLERNAALDWARWGRNHDYRSAEGTSKVPHFASFRAPMLFLSFADDTLYAPRRAVEALLRDFYVAAPRTHVHFSADALGVPLGHSGFFVESDAMRALWNDVSAWLNAHALSAEAVRSERTPSIFQHEVSNWRSQRLRVLAQPELSNATGHNAKETSHHKLNPTYIADSTADLCVKVETRGAYDENDA